MSVDWNQTKAAKYLNMTEGNIRLKMKKYDIIREETMSDTPVSDLP